METKDRQQILFNTFEDLFNFINNASSEDINTLCERYGINKEIEENSKLIDHAIHELEAIHCETCGCLNHKEKCDKCLLHNNIDK